VSLGRAERERLRRIARGRGEPGLFLLEGAKAVHDALETGAVTEVWVREEDAADEVADLVRRARASGVPVGGATGRDLERLSRTVTPQGVLAVVRDVARAPAQVLADPRLVVWLDGLQDPGNVGAILRVAAAFSLAGALVSEGGADPMGDKALRASAGLSLRVPFARGSPDALARACAAAGRSLLALEAGGEDLLALRRVPPKPVLVVGREGSGVSPAASSAAAVRVGIPMAAGVDSLNVAVAAGIAAAFLVRGAGASP